MKGTAHGLGQGKLMVNGRESSHSGSSDLKVHELTLGGSGGGSSSKEFARIVPLSPPSLATNRHRINTTGTTKKDKKTYEISPSAITTLIAYHLY